ncbi:MAG: Bug family tripartite tricarboxylate transporter substrate binding protein [Burkholderiales bacterium]
MLASGKRALLCRIFGFTLLALASGSATHAVAQGRYPDRPIRLVIPFAPGGETDIFTRAIAGKLGDVLGQQIVPENRAGATGIVASEFVAKSRPDGYTLIFGTAATHALNLAVFKTLPYHPLRDFEPIAFVGSVPIVLFVHPSMPGTLKEFIALLKANPGKYSYGAAGSSTSHLGIELLKAGAGVSIAHIPYKGTGPALQDTVSGQVQILPGSIGVGLPMVQAGRLRAVAVMARQRLAAAPDVPTFAESGMADFEVGTWNVVMAPLGTPKPIVDRVNAALNETLRDPGIRERLIKLGITPVDDSTPASTAETVTREIAKWARAFELAGGKPE